MPPVGISSRVIPIVSIRITISNVLWLLLNLIYKSVNIFAVANKVTITPTLMIIGALG